jgi:hypothetical protein
LGRRPDEVGERLERSHHRGVPRERRQGRWLLTGPERDDLFSRQAALRPAFAEYQRRTTREIPVIALEPIDP